MDVVMNDVRLLVKKELAAANKKSFRCLPVPTRAGR